MQVLTLFRHETYMLKMAKKERSVFSEWLVQARKARGFSQDDLATAIGMDQGYISKMENGFVPPFDTVERIARALVPEYADDSIASAVLSAGLRAAFPRPEDAKYQYPDPADYVRTVIREKGYDDQKFDIIEIENIAENFNFLIEGHLTKKRIERGEIE